MCKACEVGKIVINKCIERGMFINTQKVQKLLVLMQVECIKRANRPLFKEDIRIWNCGLAIKEVDDEFQLNSVSFFDEKQVEYIHLLEIEEQSVDDILCKYGELDASQLNELPTNQEVIRLGEISEGNTTPHISYQKLMEVYGTNVSL